MRKRGDVSSKSKATAALEAVKAHEPLGSIARRYKFANSKQYRLRAKVSHEP